MPKNLFTIKQLYSKQRVRSYVLHNMLTAVVGISLLFLSFDLAAQELSYYNFTINDGLPSNFIYDIHQDSDGFLWFGTDNGLSRYDGANFVNYTKLDGLPDSEILGLFEDNQQRLWLATFNGKLGYYHKGKFYNEHNTPFLKNVSTEGFILDIVQNKKGELFFASRKKIVKIYKDQVSIIKFPFDERSITLAKNNVFKLVKDKNDEVWMYLKTSNQLYRLPDFHVTPSDLAPFDVAQQQKLVRIKEDLAISDILQFTPQEKTMIQENIYSKCIENDNYIWLYGGSTPLQLLDSKSKKTIFQSEEMLMSTGIKDQNDNIWMGSLGSGIFYFPKSKVFTYKRNKSLKGLRLSSFYINPTNQSIYCGAIDGHIHVISKNKITTIKSDLSEGGNPRIRYMSKGFGDNLWLIADNDMFLSFNPQTLEVKNEEKLLQNDFYDRGSFAGKSFFVDKEKQIALFATAHDVKFVEQKNDKKRIEYFFDKRSTVVYLDHKKMIWIGTENGLYYTDDWDEFSCLKKENIADNITTIQQVDTTLIVGTKGGGILLINGSEIKKITKQDGLPSDAISNIFVTKNKNVWLATDNGVCKITGINTAQTTFTSLTTQHGLIENNVLDCTLVDSTLYVLSPEGITLLPIPINRLQNEVNNPKIYINKILVNDELLSTDSLLDLSHKQNNLTIQYSGIYLGNRRKLEYVYQLKNYHQDWHRTQSNELQFDQLPPNNYELEIYATVDGWKSLETTKLHFNIVPAFYQRKSIQLLGLCLTVLCLYWIVKYFFDKEKEKSEAKAKLLELENQTLQLQHKALLLQMDPHFIKNCLSAIQHLIIEKDIIATNKYLSIFGELITRLVHQPKDTFTILDDEIQLLKLYLSMEKLRFDENLEYSLDCPSNGILSEKIPSMMIQPLIENAIVHGFKGRKGEKKNQIFIKISPQKDYIACTIQDNGIGISKKLTTEITKTKGISLRNINERIGLLMKKYPETHFQIEETSEEGTVIKLKLPLLNYDQVRNN